MIKKLLYSNNVNNIFLALNLIDIKDVIICDYTFYLNNRKNSNILFIYTTLLEYAIRFYNFNNLQPFDFSLYEDETLLGKNSESYNNFLYKKFEHLDPYYYYYYNLKQ